MATGEWREHSGECDHCDGRGSVHRRLLGDTASRWLSCTPCGGTGVVPCAHCCEPLRDGGWAIPHPYRPDEDLGVYCVACVGEGVLASSDLQAAHEAPTNEVGCAL